MAYQHIAYLLLGAGFIALFAASALLFPSKPETSPQPAATIDVITPPTKAKPSHEPVFFQ